MTDRGTHPFMERFFAALVRRPIAVLMGVLALLGMGLIATSRIPIELLPAGYSMTSIWVNATWNGANPHELEKQVLRPLEEEFRTIRGVERIESYAQQGSCGAILAFPGHMDMDLAYAEVADRVERVRPRLPREVDRVRASRFTAADMPVLYCGVMLPGDMDPEEAKDLLSDVLQPRLEALDGVASVAFHGIEPSAVRIWLDEERVRAAGLDLGALIGRLQQDNLSVAVGDLEDAGSRFLVRVDGRFQSLEEIAEFPIRPGLRIKDVARVVRSRDETESGFRVEGQDSLAVFATKESSANSFDVCRRLVEFFEETAPADPVLGAFSYNVFWNEGNTIRASLRELVKNATLGGLIASAVLMLFLRRVRFTLLISASIPFSVVVTFTWLYFAGGSFNLLSLMGVTISIGMLVDNSVVIVESIFKRREEGESLERAVVKGPAEVSLAVTTATLTSVIVFLPLIFMTNDRNTRLLTSAIAAPLCISLLAALVLALLIVPVASRHLSMGHNGTNRLDRLLARFSVERPVRRGLAALVDWSQRHRVATLVIGGVFCATGMVASRHTPLADRSGFGGAMEVRFDLAANLELSEAVAEVKLIEQALDSVREEIGDPVTGVQYSRKGGQINCWYEVNPHPDERARVLKLLAETLPRRPAVKYFFEQFQREAMEDKGWTRILVEGPESLTVEALAEKIREKARHDPTFQEVAEEDEPAREVVMTLDRERMTRLGVNSQQVLGTVEGGLRGFMVSRFETDRVDLPILVEFDAAEERPSRSRLTGMAVAETAAGVTLPLDTVASFESRIGPRSIHRRDGKVSTMVGLKSRSVDLRQRAAEVEALMADLELPEGYRWSLEGGLMALNEDMMQLMSALLLAVVLDFLLMGLLFESFLLPFSVLFTIPFAVFGAYWAFYLTNEPINAVGIVGLIVLAGVVVNNGIVLVDRILQLVRQGHDRDSAIRGAVQDRLRPVVMTAATTIVGLLPIALAAPTGDGFSFKGLAICVAGGLFASTFFTLWVVPVMYTLFLDLGHAMAVLLPPSWRPRPAAPEHPASV